MMAVREAVNAVTAQRDSGRWINLPLTLRTWLAEIMSREPAEGALIVTLRVGGPLGNRPNAQPQEGGSMEVAIPLAARATTVLLLAAAPGSRVTIRSPLIERVKSRQRGGITLTVQRAGATVVRVVPPRERYAVVPAG
ncbi:MAG: hypothetical protein NZ773_04625 [Dehalococcoidia bacterium]|nr:hypothetical protein [Dehalococcoidia bacterium]